MNDCKTKAIFWLTELRTEGYYWHTIAIPNMQLALCRCNLTLKDIGTSEAEIEALRIKGCTTVAMRWLTELRSEVSRFNLAYSALRLRNALSAGGLLPKDIETSENEISSFSPT